MTNLTKTRRTNFCSDVNNENLKNKMNCWRWKMQKIRIQVIRPISTLRLYCASYLLQMTFSHAHRTHTHLNKGARISNCDTFNPEYTVQWQIHIRRPNSLGTGIRAEEQLAGMKEKHTQRKIARNDAELLCVRVLCVEAHKHTKFAVLSSVTGIE